jgi:hypothetical protein
MHGCTRLLRVLLAPFALLGSAADPARICASRVAHEHVAREDAKTAIRTGSVS